MNPPNEKRGPRQGPAPKRLISRECDAQEDTYGTAILQLPPGLDPQSRPIIARHWFGIISQVVER
jgi:hypothetical protein